MKIKASEYLEFLEKEKDKGNSCLDENKDDKNLINYLNSLENKINDIKLYKDQAELELDDNELDSKFKLVSSVEEPNEIKEINNAKVYEEKHNEDGKYGHVEKELEHEETEKRQEDKSKNKKQLSMDLLDKYLNSTKEVDVDYAKELGKNLELTNSEVISKINERNDFLKEEQELGTLKEENLKLKCQLNNLNYDDVKKDSSLEKSLLNGTYVPKKENIPTNEVPNNLPRQPEEVQEKDKDGFIVVRDGEELEKMVTEFASVIRSGDRSAPNAFRKKYANHKIYRGNSAVNAYKPHGGYS